MKYERGQSLVESLVAVLALVPMLASLWLIAGLHDLRVTVDGAARYLAFHRALQPTLSRASGEDLVRRHVIDSSRTWNESPGSATWTEYPPLWHSPFALARWIESPSHVRIGHFPSALDAIAGASTGSLQALLATLPGTEAGNYAPERSGLDRDEVSADVLWSAPAPLPERLRVASTLSVLAGSGPATGPAQLEQQLRGISSFGLLDWAERLLAPLRPLLRILEPDYAHSCIGVLAVEVLPPDRLDRTSIAPTLPRELPERCL